MKGTLLIAIIVIFCMLVIPLSALQRPKDASVPTANTQNNINYEPYNADIYEKIKVLNGDKITEYSVNDYLFGVVAAEMPALYEEEAIKCLNHLFQTNNYALLTGGSMMYVDAVCKGIDDIPTVDADTRAFMMERYEQEGLEPLCAELRLLDPEYYAEADIKNPKRVMHALEICYMTGKKYSSFRTRKKKQRPFNIIKIGLRRDREELYERINRRVDIMIEQGLVEEVKRFVHLKEHNSLNTVGYKEIFKYLDGEWTLDFAIEKIKQNTRIYSRKQVTWYQKDEEITWFHPDDIEGILKHIEEKI